MPPAEPPAGGPPVVGRPPPRVVVVDDHVLLVQALVLALRAQGCEVHAPSLTQGASVSSVLEDVGSQRPDVVLLDLDLGDDLGDGVDLVPELAARGASVVVMSGTTDRTRPAAALEAGAVGYVAKSEPFEQLLAVVMEAARGRPVMTPQVRHEMLSTLRSRRQRERRALAPFDALTPREQDVLAGLVDGASVTAMAQRWVLSEATVRTQVRGVLVKLGVASQLAAVAKARDAGWSAPAPREGKMLS